jgi:hypothetical protein
MPNIWIFSNRAEGHKGDSDWDTSTIVRRKRYYFKASEKNRSKVEKGDTVLFREYGSGFWGTCKISGSWVEDKKALEKYPVKAGWFPIDNIDKWKATLPYEIIRSELTNQNHRLRIAAATEDDRKKIELALKIYRNLGYGEADGNFFVLESGVEEAVKANLSQLKLRLAGNDIEQQCSLEIGIGRTDLICLDEKGNYVVLELKATRSSDDVVGQILRYIGYIREKWAQQNGKEVKGIILAPSYDEQLRLAAKEAGIRVLRVRII